MKFLLNVFVIVVSIFGPWDTAQGLICHTNTHLLNNPSKTGDQGDHVRNCTEFMVPRDELACIKLDYAERSKEQKNPNIQIKPVSQKLTIILSMLVICDVFSLSIRFQWINSDKSVQF